MRKLPYLWIVLAAMGRPGLAADDAAAKPVLHLADSEFNWGKAFRGEQLEHEFIVENKGNATLVIESLKPNCGCMSVQNEADYKRKLEPGEKTKIVLHIDTRILEPGFVKNKFTEVITNATADENQLTIVGEIEELLKITPSHPTVDVIRGGPPGAPPVIFGMEATGGRKVKIQGLSAQKGILSVTLRELQKETKFEVSLRPTLKDLKTVFQSEDLETNLDVDGRSIPFRLQVAVQVKDRIEVEPSLSVYFFRFETAAAGQAGAAKAMHTLELTSLGGPSHKFKVTGVVVKDKVFAATVDTLEEGKRYRLNVTLERSPKEGERFLKDTIELTTDDPEVPTIKIPASAQF